MVVTLVVDQAVQLKLQVITKAVATPVVDLVVAAAQVVAVVPTLEVVRIPLVVQVKELVVLVMDKVQAKALVKV